MTDEHRHIEAVMGTRVTLVVRHRACPAEQVRAAVGRAVAELHHADRLFSLYRPDSALSRLRSGELPIDRCPPEVTEVLALAERCAARTGSGFDPWWRGDGQPDPTGLVKGWAVERASAALGCAGFDDHLIAGAGDVRARGSASPGRPWAVGIADPHRPGQLAAVVECDDVAVATSGTAEQGLHIIDSRTGRPADHLASATVVGPDLGVADAYATAAIALGPEAPGLLVDLDAAGWSSLTISRTGERWTSPGFPGHPLGHAGSPPEARRTPAAAAGSHTAFADEAATAARRRVAPLHRTEELASEGPQLIDTDGGTVALSHPADGAVRFADEHATGDLDGVGS